MRITSASSIVLVRELCKSYGTVSALQGLNLELTAGEMYGLIGPDGAGKTTLLRILCGLIVPDAGSVRVLGYDPVLEQNRIKAQIGYMPQRFSLYPDLTVRENLHFFARIFRIRKAEEERLTRRLLEFSRLGAFSDRKADALSGGMKQKLALSCTLIHTPKLLILDEPTTGVDPVSRNEFWEILEDLRRERVTILVTTPYMDEAARCDRVSLIYQGRALAGGTPEQITAEFPYVLFRVYTPQPHEAAELLRKQGDFPSVHIYGDRVHVAAAGRTRAEDQIRRILDGAKCPFSLLEEAEPSLEDTFVHLLQQ
jgi:ABC-2 type transport system ATP-binding protein